MRMPIFFLSVVLAIGLNLSPAPANAQTLGTPDIYQMTINRFELSSDNGATYTEVGSGGLIFNLAAVNAGAQVGTYFSGGSPLSPSTTYNRMRVTISCTLTLLGCAGGVCTRAGTDQPGGAAPAVEGQFTIPVAGVPECATGQASFQSPAEGQAGAISCTTAADGGLDVTFSFDVTDRLVLANPILGTLEMRPPNASFTCP